MSKDSPMIGLARSDDEMAGQAATVPSMLLKGLAPETLDDLRAEAYRDMARAANPYAEQVDHPAHYGGADNPYEAIKVIEAWGLGFCLGNTVKYVARAGLKPDTSSLVDLRKAAWYLNREIERLAEGT